MFRLPRVPARKEQEIRDDRCYYFNGLDEQRLVAFPGCDVIIQFSIYERIGDWLLILSSQIMRELQYQSEITNPISEDCNNCVNLSGSQK